MEPNSKVGNLTLISSSTPGGTTIWLCKCGCGETISVLARHLELGIVSCGCLDHEIPLPERPKTLTPEYQAYKNAIRNCTNPKAHSYAKYGRNGIKVCPRWKRSFPAFLKDMGPRPSIDHRLCRKNTLGNFTPDNCYWETAKNYNAAQRNAGSQNHA